MDHSKETGLLPPNSCFYTWSQTGFTCSLQGGNGFDILIWTNTRMGATQRHVDEDLSQGIMRSRRRLGAGILNQGTS